MTNPMSSKNTAEDSRWQIFMARDAAADGRFVVAVRSTGIYCRPSCPSRRPKRENVLFFDAPAAAEAAGFRACRRCRPEIADGIDPAVAEMARQACRLIERSLDAADPKSPSLARLGAQLGVSPHRLQRGFHRVLGVTPKEYADACRIDRLKSGLKAGDGVAGALYGAGFGSTSRLYERAAKHLGMTPASYARGGKGAAIRYATGASPLGRLLVAATAQGICFVGLADTDEALEGSLREDFPLARIDRDSAVLEPWLAAVLAVVEGRLPSADLPLDVRGTAFQWQVWRELSAIPAGRTRSYREIAEKLGRPGASRAVGRACATNPVSIVVPCHRAIGSDGALHGYRWGLERKRELLRREAAAD